MEQVHIGHYILGRTIGSGGFAKVKQARHDLTGVRVAIKILNKRKMKNKNMIPKVKREIKILKFISHPNIIKLYEVLDTTNDIFVVMELAERGELFDYLQNNQISEDQAKFFFRQLIQGLAYAHSNLIAHRDLKPQNILIDADRVVKIVDFGLSNLMKDGRLLKTACGSINYAAPEIVGEQRYEGTSVDIWSCGVILYALLVGRLPFHEETISLLYRRIQAGSYTIPESINPLAADLIRRMLQVDPYRRIRIHQIRNHPWIRPYIPLYARLSTALEPEREYSESFDRQVFEQIKTFTYANPLTKSDTSMRKAIRRRQDDSFVVAYQLLAYTKRNQRVAGDLVKSITITTPHNLILSQVENIVVEAPSKPREFQFGRRFNVAIKPLIYFVLQAMRQMLIKHVVKSTQYCLKCLYYPLSVANGQIGPRSASMEVQAGMDFAQTAKEAAQHEGQGQVTKQRQRQRLQKFSKREIRFSLQIYSCGGGEHMIDLQLTQGHPLVFFRMAKALYNMIQKLLHY